MPTIRAVFPVTLKLKVELSRDFDLNERFQVADALYRRLAAMDESEAIDYLMEAIDKIGKGAPTVPLSDA